MTIILSGTCQMAVLEMGGLDMLLALKFSKFKICISCDKCSSLLFVFCFSFGFVGQGVGQICKWDGGGTRMWMVGCSVVSRHPQPIFR